MADLEVTRTRTIRFTARIGLFTSAAVVAGYLFMAVPNVELITAVVALSGLLLGPGGALTGIFAMMIYGALNAYGPAYPHIWIAQMVGMGMVGFLFGLLRNCFRKTSAKLLAFLCMVTGVFCTLLYDLITNSAIPLFTGIMYDHTVRIPLHSLSMIESLPLTLSFTFSGWHAVFIGALPFTLLHTGSNALIFLLVVPVVYRQLLKRV